VPTNQQGPSNARRNFVKKAAYIAPAIATLKAAPAFAKNGSTKPKDPKPKNPKSL
jgi:hypothetical protein